MAKVPTLALMDSPFGRKESEPSAAAPAAAEPAPAVELPAAQAAPAKKAASAKRGRAAKAPSPPPSSVDTQALAPALELEPPGWRKVSVNMRVAQGLWDHVGELAAELPQLETNRTEITEAAYWLLLRDPKTAEDLVRQYRRLRADR